MVDRGQTDDVQDSRPLDGIMSLSIAKEYLLTDWFHDSSERLFDEDTRKRLERMRTETEDELVRLRQLGRELARALESSDDPTGLGNEATRLTRLEFLNMLLEAKDAAGEAIEKTALLAPSPWLRDALLELAAIDFRHANEIREITAQIFKTHVATKGPSKGPEDER